MHRAAHGVCGRAYNWRVNLSQRQAAILRAVVDEFQTSRRPVGSKTIVSLGVVEASPSTVRYELGRLEELGLLEHPHTSAGRVPTDLGYRTYVDRLMGRDLTQCAARGFLPGERHMRIEEALSLTTRALSEATCMLALVTTPPAQGAVIRHIEVLLLQPRKIVVVCITERGDVTRRVIMLPEPADSGLVDWASAYLNEQVTGMTLGANLLRQRLAAPELSPVERGMLAMLAPAFIDVVAEAAGPDVHVGGTSALIGELGNDVAQIMALVDVLDERRRLLDAMRRAIAGHRVVVRIGHENELPELQPLSIVGAPYGLAARPLGVVGVIGPRNMDYRQAIGAVGSAAESLSGLVDDLYTS